MILNSEHIIWKHFQTLYNISWQEWLCKINLYFWILLLLLKNNSWMFGKMSRLSIDIISVQSNSNHIKPSFFRYFLQFLLIWNRIQNIIIHSQWNIITIVKEFNIITWGVHFNPILTDLLNYGVCRREGR